MNVISESNYVDIAEQAIKKLKGKKDRNGRDIQMVTTSKIRNLLSMTMDIYNEMMALSDEKLSEGMIGRINYLKVRFIYEAGREPKVKDLAEEAKLIEIISSIKTRSDFLLFTRYMESLIAFHRYYGGKDN